MNAGGAAANGVEVNTVSERMKDCRASEGMREGAVPRRAASHISRVPYRSHCHSTSVGMALSGRRPRRKWARQPYYRECGV